MNCIGCSFPSSLLPTSCLHPPPVPLVRACCPCSSVTGFLSPAAPLMPKLAEEKQTCLPVSPSAVGRGANRGWQTRCWCFVLHTSLFPCEMICLFGCLALDGSCPRGSLQHALTANSELFIQLIPVTRQAISEQDSKQNVFSGAGQVPVSLCYIISVFLAKSSQKPHQNSTNPSLCCHFPFPSPSSSNMSAFFSSKLAKLKLT